MAYFFNTYKGLIIDVWGVMHDGDKSLPGAQELLNLLHNMQKPHVLLTNSPRRVRFIKEKYFDPLGLTLPSSTRLISCGELIYQDLKEGVLHKYSRKHDQHLRIRIIDHESVDFFQGIDTISLCEDIKDADLVFFATLNEETQAFVQEELKQAQDLSIPVICANPDTFVYHGTKKVLRPGSLIYQYKGPVIHYGKPHGRIYSEALRHLNAQKRDVLSIGDNPLTDGKASHNYGFDFYLIRNELSEYMYHNENIPHHALGEYPSLQELLERQSTQQDA